MITRWAWYFTIARLFDALLVAVTALVLPFYYLFGRRWGIYRRPIVRITPAELIGRGPHDPLRVGIYSDKQDSHNLMCQVGHGFFHPQHANIMLTQAVAPDGSLYRRVPFEPHNNPPSRDMLSAWCYFYVACSCHAPGLVSEVAEHHWSNVFGMLDLNGNMSPRCTNGGLMPIGNGKWSAPAGPQQVLSTMAILGLAAREVGGKWRYRYHLYRILSFGWFWERFPWLPIEFKSYTYVGHTTQMNLYVMHKCGYNQEPGLRWNAVTVKPKQGIQPFIGGMAAECGVLTEKEKAEALEWLCSQTVTWPQYGFLYPFNPDHDCWSMMAHCAVQLTGVADEHNHK